jgi:hypothetical protein
MFWLSAIPKGHGVIRSPPKMALVVALAKMGWPATPMWPKGVAQLILHFFFLFFYLLKKNLKIKIIYIWQLRVAILMVLCVANVKIRQFWMEKLTDVLFLSFSTTQVSPMKKMKTV